MNWFRYKLRRLVSDSSEDHVLRERWSFLQENPWIIPFIEGVRAEFLEHQSSFGELESSKQKLRMRMFDLVTGGPHPEFIWRNQYLAKLQDDEIDIIQDVDALRMSIERRLTALFKYCYAIDYAELLEGCLMKLFADKPKYREAATHFYGLCGHESVKSYAALGRKMGLSAERCRQMIARITCKLKSQIHLNT